MKKWTSPKYPIYAPDTLMYPTDEWVEDAVYRGPDGARRLFASWAVHDLAVEVHEVRDAGSRVVALFEMTGRIKGLARVQLHADLTILAKLACALSRARAVPLAA